MNNNAHLEAALDFIAHGLGVIPLREGEKTPATKHGLDDWNDNPRQIRHWWDDNPSYNVGVVCGDGGGERRVFLVAIDLDVHDKNHDGTKALREWELAHGELPETWTQITGSGGKQLFYSVKAGGIANSANGELGVDIRGEGGYVVMPPSLHPCGEPYEWSISPDDCDLAEADANVLAFIDYVRPAHQKAAEDGTRVRFELPEVIDHDRNNTLFSYGRSLLGKGVPEAVTRELVLMANNDRCKPPLPLRDLEATIKSACSVGVSEPKAAPPAQATEAEAEPVEVPNFRGEKGKIKTNLLAQALIKVNLARSIDGAPAVWTGRRWEFGKAAIARATLELADDATSAQRNEVYGYIVAKAPSVTSDTYFDGLHYAQFQNITWCVESWREVEPQPTMFINGTLAIPMDMKRMPETENYADEFLGSVSAYDDDTFVAMAQVIGACMVSGRAVPQAAMLIGRANGGAESGTASNGKSTYINAIRAILGPENVSSLGIDDFSNNFAASAIMGKLANLGDDIPAGFLDSKSTSLFKKLVTGDAISADVKYAERVDFRPCAQHVYSMNEVPRFKGVTAGELRRMAFVPFRASFRPGMPGYDPDAGKKLAEPDVLMRLAYVGLVNVAHAIAEGRFYTIPDMAAEVEAVRYDSDSVLRWMDDCGIELAEIIDHTNTEVYHRYTSWCDDAGEYKPVSMAAFSKRIGRSERFGEGVRVTTVPRKEGGHGVRVYATKTAAGVE